MNTITLDNATYNSVVDYAETNNITIVDVVKAGMQLLKAQFARKNKTESHQQYYISPKVKSLETGFQCPTDLSEDYKQEMADCLSKKYL